jgi:bacterioferritin-associated ferredoxin
MYVCVCKGIRECDVRNLVAGRCVEPCAIVSALGWDDPRDCGRCRREVESIIEQAGGVTSPAAEFRREVAHAGA